MPLVHRARRLVATGVAIIGLAAAPAFEGASRALATRLDRRLGRDVARLVRAEDAAKRRGCDLETFAHEVDVLVGQIDAYGRP